MDQDDWNQISSLHKGLPFFVYGPVQGDDLLEPKEIKKERVVVCDRLQIKEILPDQTLSARLRKKIPDHFKVDGT